MGALGAFPATLLLFVEIHPFSVLSSPGENCQRGRDLRGGEEGRKRPEDPRGPWILCRTAPGRSRAGDVLSAREVCLGCSSETSPRDWIHGAREIPETGDVQEIREMREMQ